jgi:hypothetical protein
MDAALTVEKLRLVVQWHNRPVPNVRMEIEATTAVAPEGDELIRHHIVPGQSERYHETMAVKRIEKLAAVRVIIGAPDQGAFAHPIRGARGRFFWPVAPAEEIAVAHRVVSGVQRLALPAKFEQPFDYAP